MIRIKDVLKILNMDNNEVNYYKLRYPQYFVKGNHVYYDETFIYKLKHDLNESIYKCEFCGKKFLSNENLQNHLFICDAKRKSNLEKINNDEFINLYKNGYSLYELEKKYGVNRELMEEVLKNNNVEIRTLSESAKSPRRLENFKNSCLERYGTENVLSKGTEFYEKRNKTVKEKYGVDNVFQLNEVKRKSLNTMLDKYGMTIVEYSHLHSNKGKLSKPHKKVSEFLTECKIEHINEATGKFVSKVDGKLKCPIPDILIENKKIVIEIYGNFWHANPKYYKPNDLFDTWDGKKTASEIWKHDSERKEYIESFGYKVYEIWEDDIVHKDLHEILNFLF